jgi:hypothetical protein
MGSLSSVQSVSCEFRSVKYSCSDAGDLERSVVTWTFCGTSIPNPVQPFSIQVSGRDLSTAQSGKIDPDTGSQFDEGPGCVRYSAPDLAEWVLGSDVGAG